MLPALLPDLLALAAPAAPVAPAAPADSVVAIVNVTVVPMDRERTLARQTVVVRDGRIAAVGPHDRVAVPAGAVRVDGRGKFLLPGLVLRVSDSCPSS